MRTSARFITFCASLVLLGSTSIGQAADTVEPGSGSGNIQIEMDSGALTLEAHDASLFEVLQAIGKLAEFKTVMIDDDFDPVLISVSLDNVSVQVVVERLLRDTNRIIFYKAAPDGAERSEISQVWLLGPGSAGVDQTVGNEESVVLAEDLQHDDGTVRSEAALRLANTVAVDLPNEVDNDRVLNRLIQMVEGDYNALVRARAAIALGALGDEKAVKTLEAVLLDAHSSVRSQAINALGQIGGDRATTVLGNILLYGSADPLERVMAAQALWKQDSEAARRYLRTGAYDTNEQVRSAASKAPSSPAKRLTTDRLGSEETQ